METAIKIFFGALACVLILLMVDCSCGSTRYLECSVADRHYVAAWTETKASTDGEGHTSFSTIHHPEQFHVYCTESGTGKLLDVQTTSGIYHSVTNNQPVTVKTRQGRWLKAHYLAQIIP